MFPPRNLNVSTCTQLKVGGIIGVAFVRNNKLQVVSVGMNSIQRLGFAALTVEPSLAFSSRYNRCDYTVFLEVRYCFTVLNVATRIAL